jgi:predicted metal-dependent peptidase
MLKEEDQKIFDSAKARIEKVVVRWSLEDEMLFGVWCIIEKQVSKKQETLGIDARSNPPLIKYNPYFINSLNDEVLELVLSMETLKVLLKHPTNRLLNPKFVSSLASNVTINQVMNKETLRVLDENNVDGLMKEFGLKENQYFEEYFRNLMDKQEELKQSIIEQFMQQQQEPQEGDGQGQGQGGQGGEGEPQEGDGQGQGGGEGKDESKDYKKFSDQNGAMKEYSNPMGTGNCDWGENGIFDSEIEEFVNNNKGSSKKWGKVTGNLHGEIVVANTRKVPWYEILKYFNRTVTMYKQMSTRKKLNRRHDLAQPGYRSDCKSKILYAQDVSGSMDDDACAESVHIVNNICGRSQIEYMQFDTEIKYIDKKYKKPKRKMDLHGRGGTDFQCVIDYAEKHKYDGLIIFTDGYASAPTKPKNLKVLWIMSEDNDPPVEWGYKTKFISKNK